MSDETKKCPFCAEEVLAVAIKCKHCGSMLSGAAPGVALTPEPQMSQTNSELLGIFLLCIPLASAVLIQFWVGSMNLLQGPGSSLSAIGIGTILLTAILIAVEANQLGVGTDNDVDAKGTKRSGPVAWFVFAIFLWIAAYPAYLYNRSRYGAKNLVVGAILVTLVFVASWWMMQTEINEHVSAIQQNFNNLSF